MTCGIYLLQFSNKECTYIGQSLDIEHRYKKHKEFLRNNNSKANRLMRSAYAKYGYPELSIICECSPSELNRYEKEAFEIFKPTLNIATEPDIHLSGTSNPASKYSEDQILTVLILLGSPEYKYAEISEITGVSVSTIRHISNREAHAYLQQTHPEEYKKMLEVNKTRMSTSVSSKARGIVHPDILSPTGEVYKVENINQFAKEHGLDPSSLRKVLTKQARYHSHKGWKLK